MSAAAATRDGRTSPLEGLLARMRRVSPEAWLSTLLTLGFLGLSAWWLTQETRTPDPDSAMHIFYSFEFHNLIAAGQWSQLFHNWNTYPPLGHLVGAIGVFIGGWTNASVIFALNVVFVPVLAASCYGTGKLVAGPRAGLLAVVFALGNPMIISEAHEAYVDPIQTAFVAATVWAVLASDRFRRPGVSALAGLATGLAFMSKETSPVFFAGVIAVVLVRGGWKQWKGLLAYVAPILIVAAPWYWDHRTLIHQLFIAHSAEANIAEANPFGVPYPTLWSVKNLSWYFWDAANIQLLLPLLALFLVGLVFAVRSCWRDRSRGNLYPELLGGAFVSWAVMTWLTHKDPRYDLPAMIYFAVIGTAWIVTLRRQLLRRCLAGLLVLAVAANFAGVEFGVGGQAKAIRITLPGAADGTPLLARRLTLYTTYGWLRGAPDHKDGDVLALMRGAKRDGFTGVTFCCVNPIDLTIGGLADFAIEAGLPTLGEDPQSLASLTQHDIFIEAHSPVPGDPPPCQYFDGTGIYAEVGSPYAKPFAQLRYFCPTHKPEIY